MLTGLQQGEVQINSWSIVYQPLGGRKYKGQLTVTNRRVVFESPFDMDAKHEIPEKLFIRWSSMGYLEIDRADIYKAEIRRRFLNSKAMLTLTDGSQHILYPGWKGSGAIVRAVSFAPFI
jgi:hypothetical protein